LDRLEPAAILKGLSTRVLGRRIVYRESVESTNSVAKSLARQGAIEGTLVVAEEQTAGRGRLGRRWFSPRGASLLLSLIFRPDWPVSRAQGLTMICGLSIREVIREVTGLPVGLKWPNDITISGRKAGGILTETSSSGVRLDYAIVGLGLNVNLERSLLPAEFRATSLSHELGRTVPRVPLLQALLRHMEQRYLALCGGEWPAVEWAEALETLGQRVTLHTAEGRWQGQAIGVDQEGALLLRLEDGQTKPVHAGDIVEQPEP
jgi:BirA family biotin operon repressor/biotin-[acetyl-CoA-carboxylase] ligase